ncbi:flagellar export chaperone FliS [Pseudomonadales bacterium]|nr:flagellar export chaperone FliS [Pseudomonadales bacterium]MDB2509484.1 flagellar export chaperone FliS [Pseudomonadales bacterium]
MNRSVALSEYKTIGVKSGVEGADPHQLIGMLLKGAMGKISEAKAAMLGGQIALKGEAVGKAIAIVEYLRVSLDPGIDAAFSEQLGELYRYIETRLLAANLKNDTEALDEAQALLRELSAGWAGIPDEYRAE